MIAFIAGLLMQSGPLPKAEAQRVLDRYYRLIHGAKTIYFVEEASEGGQSYRGESWLMRPRRYRCVMVGADQNGKKQERRSVMTDKAVYEVDPDAKTYSIMDRYPGSPFINGLEPFCQAKRPQYTVGGKVRESTFGGVPAYAIETGEQSLPGSMVSVYVDRKTLIPIGWEYAWRGRSELHAYKDFKLNEPMNASDFEWRPKGLKLKRDMRMPKRGG
jgi:outer membrane lipoprotein-sorting protein